MPALHRVITCYWIFKHKLYVLYYIIVFCLRLIWRGVKHDNSKFSKEEFKYIYKAYNTNVKFGTRQYYSLTRDAASARNLHAMRNRHHPEFYGNINRMSIIDLAEMLCDWKAATKRVDGDIIYSLRINTKRYKIDRDLVEAIRRDINELGF